MTETDVVFWAKLFFVAFVIHAFVFTRQYWRDAMHDLPDGGNDD